MQGIAAAVSDGTVLSWTSNLYSSLEQQRITKETEHVISSNIFTKDLILIHIHHRYIAREGQHWSMVGLFVQKKIICYCDSLYNLSSEIYSTLCSFIKHCSIRCEKKIDLNEWTFITPLDISQQRNNHDCGVYTCLNAYWLLTGKFFNNISKHDLYNMRYWICNIARHGYKNIIKRKVKQASFYINVDAVPITKVQRTLTLLLKLNNENWKTLFEIPTAVNNGATNSKFLLLRISFLTLPDASCCFVLEHL